MKRANAILAYILFPLSALAVGALSALLTGDSMNLYGEVATPPLSPPALLFPIVWTVLYIAMGIGAAGVFIEGRKAGMSTRGALTVYLLQLVFNFAWSLIFFRARAFLFALLWLLLLWVLILRMITEFWRVRPWTGYLQLPYLLWVTFAAYLNAGIYWLNP